MPNVQDTQNPSGANPDLVNKVQRQADGQQGSTAPDSIDTGIDTDKDGDLDTGEDIIGVDGSVLDEHGSSKGRNVADNDDDNNLADDSEAEVDPQSNLEEHEAT